MKRSTRCRASIIMGSTSQGLAACPRSSSTARTMSATRSLETRPFNCANRVADIPADSCTWSAAMGLLAGSVLARVAAQRRPSLTKVVGRVGPTMDRRVPPWAQTCRSFRSGWIWALHEDALYQRVVQDGGVAPTWCLGDGVSGSVSERASVGGPACVSGRHGRLLWLLVSLARNDLGGQPAHPLLRTGPLFSSMPSPSMYPPAGGRKRYELSHTDSIPWLVTQGSMSGNPVGLAAAMSRRPGCDTLTMG
jgi:hypothetical protein